MAACEGRKATVAEVKNELGVRWRIHHRFTLARLVSGEGLLTVTPRKHPGRRG